MIAGTPDNVIPKLNKVLDVLRPGIFSFWLDGPVPAKDRMRCLELLNRDVIPAMREYGKTLGLVDPFKRAPGSRLLRAGVAPEPVSNADALRLDDGLKRNSRKTLGRADDPARPRVTPAKSSHRPPSLPKIVLKSVLSPKDSAC